MSDAGATIEPRPVLTGVIEAACRHAHRMAGGLRLLVDAHAATVL